MAPALKDGAPKEGVGVVPKEGAADAPNAGVDVLAPPADAPKEKVEVAACCCAGAAGAWVAALPKANKGACDGGSLVGLALKTLGAPVPKAKPAWGAAGGAVVVGFVCVGGFALEEGAAVLVWPKSNPPVAGA